MTKKPTKIAEREKMQDTRKIFDEAIYKGRSFSNPAPYPTKNPERSKQTDTLVAEQKSRQAKTIDTPLPIQQFKTGLAIMPYPESSMATKSNSKVTHGSSNDKLSSDKMSKWETIKTIALITTMVAGINAVSVVLGYMNGEITGLGSIIGSGLMFFILFIIVLLSWFSMIFVRKIPVKSFYSRMMDESAERLSKKGSLNNKN